VAKPIGGGPNGKKSTHRERKDDAMIKKVVTPSADTITAGQIGKICDLVSSRLRKSSLASEPTQTILEMQGNELADDVVAAIHKRVEAVSNMIVRRVSVNRNRPPRPALEATGRNLGILLAWMVSNGRNVGILTRILTHSKDDLDYITTGLFRQFGLVLQFEHNEYSWVKVFQNGEVYADRVEVTLPKSILSLVGRREPGQGEDEWIQEVSSARS